MTLGLIFLSGKIAHIILFLWIWKGHFFHDLPIREHIDPNRNATVKPTRFLAKCIRYIITYNP